MRFTILLFIIELLYYLIIMKNEKKISKKLPIKHFTIIIDDYRDVSKAERVNMMFNLFYINNTKDIKETIPNLLYFNLDFIHNQKTMSLYDLLNNVKIEQVVIKKSRKLVKDNPSDLGKVIINNDESIIENNNANIENDILANFPNNDDSNLIEFDFEENCNYF